MKKLTIRLTQAQADAVVLAISNLIEDADPRTAALLERALQAIRDAHALAREARP